MGFLVELFLVELWPFDKKDGFFLCVARYTKACAEYFSKTTGAISSKFSNDQYHV
jgi:hypothetical protein